MVIRISRLEKRILIFESIFIFASLIYLFLSTAPHQLYPINGMVVNENNFNIEIENGEHVLISSDENFDNPFVLGKDSQITLFPGIYFWKVKSAFRESEVQNFTIESRVALDIKKRDESYELQNSGNVDLNVTKETRGITSSIILQKGESKEIEDEETNYTGRQI